MFIINFSASPSTSTSRGPSTSMVESTPTPAPSAAPMTPSLEELGIADLSPAEQEQILSVMRQAELQGASMSPMAPVTQQPATHDIPMSASRFYLPYFHHFCLGNILLRSAHLFIILRVAYFSFTQLERP